jgi:carbon storage regulator
MLVLSRKIGERILIGDNVVVQVLAVRRGQIRLGISAPTSVAIRREELPPHDPQVSEPDRLPRRTASVPLTPGGPEHEPSEEHVAVAP